MTPYTYLLPNDFGLTAIEIWQTAPRCPELFVRPGKINGSEVGVASPEKEKEKPR